MTLTSPSFPKGLPKLRSEAEVRATRIPCNCPFCGFEPNNATMNRYGYFVVGCENEDCAVQPQVSDKDMSRAWTKWNFRP